MVSRVCLVHYHEIGLKGKNRSSFENKLVRNLRECLKDYPVDKVKRIPGHILITVSDEEQIELVAAAASCIPGVAKISVAYNCPCDEDLFCECAIKVLHEAEPFETFKVHARRSNTKFPLHTLELHQLVGGALCKEFEDKTVKMHHPDVQVEVHLVGDEAFIYAGSVQGVGGLPVGSAGKVVCLLSSGFDSPVSTWMVGRRGAVCIPVHFSGRPVVADTSEYLCQDICEKLSKFGMVGRLYVAPIGDYQKEIALKAPQKMRIIMYRRLMYAIAERVAEMEGAKAICVGESLGQVASQTLENITATNDVVTMPVLRPLIGSDKTEIIERAHQIGTYELSCNPAPDCCTVFMPRRPETKAYMPAVKAGWETFDHEAMINEIMENIEYIDFGNCPSYKPPQAHWRYHAELRRDEPYCDHEEDTQQDNN